MCIELFFHRKRCKNWDIPISSWKRQSIETQRHDEIYLNSYSQKEAGSNQEGRILNSSSMPIHHPAPPTTDSYPITCQFGVRMFLSFHFSSDTKHGGCQWWFVSGPKCCMCAHYSATGLLNKDIFPKLSLQSCSPVCARPLPGTCYGDKVLA